MCAHVYPYVFVLYAECQPAYLMREAYAARQRCWSHGENGGRRGCSYPPDSCNVIPLSSLAHLYGRSSLSRKMVLRCCIVSLPDYYADRLSVDAGAIDGPVIGSQDRTRHSVGSGST